MDESPLPLEGQWGPNPRLSAESYRPLNGRKLGGGLVYGCGWFQRNIPAAAVGPILEPISER